MSFSAVLTFLQQSHLATVVSILSAPIVGAVTWIRFRHGTLRFSQGRTKRLYTLLKGKQGWRTASSGALQVAVRDALRIELSGDDIRFALERDNPMLVLRTIGQARGFVRLSLDGKRYEDARRNPRLSLSQVSGVVLAIIMTGYVLLVLGGPVTRTVNPIVIGILSAINLAATPLLFIITSSASAADRLLHADTTYPLPRDFRNGNTTPDAPVAQITSPPRKRSSRARPAPTLNGQPASSDRTATTSI